MRGGNRCYAGRALSSPRVLVANQNAGNAGIKTAVGVLLGVSDSEAVLIAPTAALKPYRSRGHSQFVRAAAWPGLTRSVDVFTLTIWNYLGV